MYVGGSDEAPAYRQTVDPLKGFCHLLCLALLLCATRPLTFNRVNTVAYCQTNCTASHTMSFPQLEVSFTFFCYGVCQALSAADTYTQPHTSTH
eukprot:54530-Eustigmatos_ZCMA.PRE.1